MATKIDAWFTLCGGTCGTQHGYHMVAMLNGKLLCDGNCPAYAHTGTCRHIDEVNRELGIPTPKAPTPIRPISQAAREYAESLDFS